MLEYQIGFETVHVENIYVIYNPLFQEIRDIIIENTCFIRLLNLKREVRARCSPGEQETFNL